VSHFSLEKWHINFEYNGEYFTRANARLMLLMFVLFYSEKMENISHEEMLEICGSCLHDFTAKKLLALMRLRS
jgi:hypothetical protein